MKNKRRLYVTARTGKGLEKAAKEMKMYLTLTLRIMLLFDQFKPANDKKLDAKQFDAMFSPVLDIYKDLLQDGTNGSDKKRRSMGTVNKSKKSKSTTKKRQAPSAAETTEKPPAAKKSKESKKSKSTTKKRHVPSAAETAEKASATKKHDTAKKASTKKKWAVALTKPAVTKNANERQLGQAAKKQCAPEPRTEAETTVIGRWECGKCSYTKKSADASRCGMCGQKMADLE